MGGLLHLFDFHQGHMGRKHKKQTGAGVEAPRNSLDFPDDTRRGHCAVGDSQQDLPKRSYFTTDASMKKLINQEITKPSNNRKTAPSIVARLMGMDIVPVETKPQAQPLEHKHDKNGITAQKTKHTEKVSPFHPPQKSKSSTKKEHRSYKDAYLRYWSSGTNSGRPRPRVHPQEKELQKFKKEFEAWQAARFLECARVVELGNIPEQWLAHLDLTKEKMALYETSRKAIIDKKYMDRKSELLKSRSKKEILPPKHKETYSCSSISSSRDFEQLSLKDSDQNSEKSSSAPTKIVILKPGPDSYTTNDESWISSSCSVEDRDCIEDLLEEVKERLRFEMQGKALKKGLMVRGGGIETPFKEKPAYMKQTHQPIANKELGRRLLRSESARTYQSETRVNELVAPSSPEFMSRDARKFLSERLRNVLNGEHHQEVSNISDDFTRAPFFDDARERLEKARDILNADNGRNYWHYMNYERDNQARSFRHDQLSDDSSFQEQQSPRNLVRSLSAPVSGTSFGKLLLEDRYVSSGAHIKRKHEALDNLTIDAKGQTRERFSIREKVSNIKYSLSLRKKLFSKKLQSVDLSQCNEFDSANDIMCGPSILTRFSDRNENQTEVPPSPASVCSSPREEFWKRSDNPSPLSTSDVTSVGDHCVGNVFREISSNLTELRKQLNQLEYEGSEITTLTEDHSEPEVVDLEDEAEAYIKDILVTSGLYDGSWDKSFSRWDPYVKPVSNWVFDKVEESHQKPTHENEELPKDYCDELKLEHKMLFDLSNEALTVVLGPPRTLSKFRRKITDTNMFPRPQGRKLLEQVWEMIREYIYPSTDTAFYSLDDLVAHDLNIMPWSSLIDEEISALGKELEYQITGDLVEEVVMDMQL